MMQWTKNQDHPETQRSGDQTVQLAPVTNCELQLNLQMLNENKAAKWLLYLVTNDINVYLLLLTLCLF